MMIDAAVLGALSLTALAAGCLDAMAGGGGLITVPALLLAGLDPLSTFGTNKACGLAGSLTASISFARKGYVNWREAAPIALMSAAGGFAGALCAHFAPRPLLEAMIPPLLIAVAIFFSFYRLQPQARAARFSLLAFAATIAPAIGFYDGIFGPGTGSFLLLAFVTLRGLALLPATGCTKVANAASNVSSLGFFIAAGVVVWPIAIAMAAGAFIGAQIGAKLAIRFGAAAIRPLIVLVCLAMALRLLANPLNPLTRWLLGAASP